MNLKIEICSNMLFICLLKYKAVEAGCAPYWDKQKIANIASQARDNMCLYITNEFVANSRSVDWLFQ
jgi:hypothetical protein